MVFALISQIPYILFLSLYSNDIRLNVFFTLTLGLIAIWLHSYILKDISSKLDVKIKNSFTKLLLKLIVEFVPTIAIGIIGEISKSRLWLVGNFISIYVLLF